MALMQQPASLGGGARSGQGGMRRFAVLSTRRVAFAGVGPKLLHARTAAARSGAPAALVRPRLARPLRGPARCWGSRRGDLRRDSCALLVCLACAGRRRLLLVVLSAARGKASRGDKQRGVQRLAALARAAPPPRRPPLGVVTTLPPPQPTPTAAPPPPPLLPLLADLKLPVRQVVVLFDLESTGGSRCGDFPSWSDFSSWTITEMTATAVFVLEDGTWWVPPGGRCGFSEQVNGAKTFGAAAAQLNVFLESMSAAAGGKKVTMLAHNGPACDWPVLTCALGAIGLALPACVAALGCTRQLFVAELKSALGLLWSLDKVHQERFDGAKIPKHERKSVADVMAMERITVNAVSKNSWEWAAVALGEAVQAGTSPTVYAAAHAACYGTPSWEAPVTLTEVMPAMPQPAVPVPQPPQDVPSADPLDCAEVAALRTKLGAVFGVLPEDRDALWRAARATTALPAALCAAAPALERAVREDRARAPIALCRAVLAGTQLLVRAMGEVVR